MAIINGGYEEYKLGNDLVVATQKTPTQTITAKLRVNFGASHETDGEDGLAHFLEHCLVSGGSSKYDPLTADSIRGSFGYSNAFTNIGRTTFIAGMLVEDLESWLDYVSDHVFRPRFDIERVNGERERVLREISDEKSDPIYSDRKEFKRILYGDHPLGKFVLGKEEIIKRATPDTMRAFHERGYNSNNMDLIIVGGLPDNVKELIEKYFETATAGNNTRRTFPELRPLSERHIIHKSSHERLNVDNPDESSARIFLSYSAPVTGHEDEPAVRTMNQILGGDTNSFLFQNVGLKNGLAYDIGISYSGDYNAGVLGIDAAVPARRIDEAVSAIFGEIQRMKAERVSEESVNRIKRRVKYFLAKKFETNDGHIIAIESKLDDGVTPESFIDSYDRVTSDRILEVARKYLPDRENGKYVLHIRDPLR